MATKKIGAKIVLDGEAEYKKAVKDIDASMALLSTELRKVKSQFLDNSNSMKANLAVQKNLKKEIGEQETKIKTLCGALDDAKEKYGENSAQVQEWEKKLNNAEANLNKLNHELKESEKETNLFRKGLDKLGDAGKAAAVGVGKLASISLKGLAVGAGAAVAAITAVVKESVEAYASAEQNIGGVETLLGAKGAKSAEEYAELVGKSVDSIKSEYDRLMESQNATLNNAYGAYKTAGLSANEYMETVSSFSASLLQSLSGDTKKASEYADLAITDMSDNANKMGSDMESIQNAYQGFAKQNYTMLDNLKLGYGGTKTEMQRLVADAAKLDDSIDANSLSYANVVKAIHAVQNEMGITGTTMKEATETISGSANSMKSAWQNALMAIGSGDTDMIKTNIGHLVETAGTFGKNIMPVIKQSLAGIGQLISELVPVISAELPGLIKDILPPLLKSAGTLISSLAKNFPTLISNLLSTLPNLLNTNTAKIITQLITSILSMLPQILETGLQLIMALVNGLTQEQSLQKIIQAVITCIGELINTLLENLPMLISCGLDLIIALIDGLVSAESIDGLGEAAITCVQKIITVLGEKIPELLEKGKELVSKIISGIGDKFEDLKAKGSEIIEKAKEGIKQKIEDAKTWGKDLIQNFIDGINAMWDALKQKVSNVAQLIKDFLGFSEPEKGPLSNFHTYAPDMMDLFAQGIRENEDKISLQLEKSLNFEIINRANMQRLGYQVRAAMPTHQETVSAISVNNDMQMTVLSKIIDLLTVIASNSDKPLMLDSGVLISVLTGGINTSLGIDYTKKLRNN